MIVGIEVGGTFTDLIAIDGDGKVHIHKTPSTPDDPARAAMTGLGTLLAEIGVPGAEVGELLHGSTIAANALIQRRGARLALLTTAGFRDVLFIQRMDKSVVYDMFYQKPEPLIARDRVHEVVERMDARGRIVLPLDEAGLTETIDRLVADGIDAIAVAFLHAYANPSHEQAAGALIRSRHPGVYVALSSEISPEHREYERTSTTVISGFVGPVVDRYLGRFEAAAEAAGIQSAPLIMLSNGGVAPVAAARKLAANMFLSGPAAAVTGAAASARRSGTPDIISIDVGGTSSDVCLITNGTPQTTVKGTSEFSVEGLPLNIVMTDIVSIGAGGGSIAWIDEGRMLHVGPQSSGAAPGPACYGRGGTDFCLTDAMLLLGMLDAGIELPGGIRLDAERSRAAAAELSAALGLDPVALAESVYRIATANMAQALRRVSVKRGYDPRFYALFACGGAGPLIAAALADEVGIKEILIPANPGVFSAVGLTVCDVRMDYVLAEGAQRIGDLTAESLAEKLDGLEARAASAFAALGYPADELIHEHACDARYRGQGYELRVALDRERLAREGPAVLAALFHQEHARRYGHAFKDREVEAISFRLSARHPRGEDAEAAIGGQVPISGDNAVTGTRALRLSGKTADYPVHDRHRLGADFSARGPLIITEASSSTLVPAGWHVNIADGGALRLRRNKA